MRKTYLLLLALMALAACDESSKSSPTAPAPRDEIDVKPSVPVKTHRWDICATGRGQWTERYYPFTWSAIVAVAGHDTVEIPETEYRCGYLGTFADTTRFLLVEMSIGGMSDAKWFRIDGRDSIPLRWSGRFNKDSLTAVRWD